MKGLPRGIFEKDPGSEVYWIRYADKDGKLHREKAGSLSTARKLLASRHTAKLNGKLPDIKRVKGLLFSELIEEALTHSRSENDAHVVHDFDLKMNRVRPVFGKRPAESITRQELVKWLDNEANEREWKASTYNRWIAALSLAFRVGVTNEKIGRNPLTGVRRKHEDNDRCRYLNLDEEILLVGVLKRRHPEYVSMFILSVASGMRMSEQLRARAGDYNLAAKLLTVHQKKDRRKPKIRYVPLSRKGVEAYEQLAIGKRPKAPLCMNTAGNRMTDVTYWFKPALEEAGIADYHWHDNRHTACSRWVMGGVPLAAVAKYVGHSTIQMTMRYSHLVPKVNQAAADAMDAFYLGSVGTATDTRTDTGARQVFHSLVSS